VNFVVIVVSLCVVVYIGYCERNYSKTSNNANQHKGAETCTRMVTIKTLGSIEKTTSPLRSTVRTYSESLRIDDQEAGNTKTPSLGKIAQRPF